MSKSFHAHHSPVGAHSSLTLGMFGSPGGFAIEGDRAGNQNIYVGSIEKEQVNLFPFFANDSANEALSYDPKAKSANNNRSLHVFSEEEIERNYGPATDSFRAGELTFEIITPFFYIPSPETHTTEDSKYYSAPALFLKLELDNSKGKEAKQAVIMVSDPLPAFPNKNRETTYFEFLDGEAVLATNEAVTPVQCMGFHFLLKKDFTPFIQSIAKSFGFIFDVPAGQKKSFLLSASFYKPGIITRGLEMSYWYSKVFSSALEVASYALSNFQKYEADAKARDKEVMATSLSDAQKFLISHAIHSYYGSTQWFNHGGRSFWNVNEGEYRMLNTFDLTVDMIFYEMKYTPWSVKNVLDSYSTHYSYRDQIYEPGKPEVLYEGGLSFTHDMGSYNNFTAKGYSGYERSGLDRACFSYMTQEQLTNWICCAGIYVTKQNDRSFLSDNLSRLKECYTSMLNRDNPNPEKRNGVMSFESSRCLMKNSDGTITEGGEITTYDSLDHSLGQSRNNLYLAVKGWAAYLLLEKMFQMGGETTLAAEANRSAHLAAKTIVSHFNKELGFIPAVMEEGNLSAIIPGIEGLVFPYQCGLKEMVSEKGPFGELIKTLKLHFNNILKEGVCLYEDGGWKLSSTADNSWMSKICLCQYVAREILEIKFGKEGERHDNAHRSWEIKGATKSACSDQFRSGVAMGSLYYPRIVTNILWLEEENIQ